MEVGPNIKQYNSQNAFLDRKKVFKDAKPSLKASEKKPQKLSDKISKDKTQISKTAKEMAKREIASETLSAVGKITSDAGKVLVSSKKSLGPKVDLKKTNQAKKIQSRIPSTIIKRPGIFFIGGFNWLGMSKGNEDLSNMTKFISGAEYFRHNDDGEILEAILKRPMDKPIILVGQGLGGDTAVDLANKLNSMKYGFRKIDLLVTLDSVGVGNDVIPQNVEQNLNFFSGDGGLLNDGPNVAIDTDNTRVINQIQNEDITSSKDVQYKIFDSINSILGDSKIQNQISKLSLMDINNRQLLARD